MHQQSTRRRFLAQVGAAVAGCAASGELLAALGSARAPDDVGTGSARGSVQARSRVAVARDELLTRGPMREHRELLRKLLDAGLQKVTEAGSAAAAWQSLFKPDDRIGIKVNTLGFSTQPAVVDAIVSGLRRAGVPAENIIIWDRFDVELADAGFKLNKSSRSVQCRGTDAEQIGSGYQRNIETSGSIGSCFSRIVAQQVDALISVPVLKDHNLAGASLGMKNFYGAIHNPNKYHDDNCDPYIVDVVSHRYVLPKWRLTVCDGTRAQYNAGPGRHPGFAWPFAGLIVSTDFVAADAVAANLLDAHRQARGLKSLSQENRPAKHIATAASRGLGQADLSNIERIEV